MRRLPAKFALDKDQVPVSEGRVVFIRWVSAYGKIYLLGQSFAVGRRHKYSYVRVVLDTRCQRLTVYLAGKVLNRWPYKLHRK